MASLQIGMKRQTSKKGQLPSKEQGSSDHPGSLCLATVLACRVDLRVRHAPLKCDGVCGLERPASLGLRPVFCSLRWHASMVSTAHLDPCLVVEKTRVMSVSVRSV